jgi:SnoaL-like protein
MPQIYRLVNISLVIFPFDQIASGGPKSAAPTYVRQSQALLGMIGMDLDIRLQALEARVRLLEDQLAIYQVMAAYGPAADAGATDQAVALWTDDGAYDLHARVMVGHEDIARELEGEWHQGLIGRGSAHIVSMPRVEIAGDKAVATCHSRLYRREGDGDYRVISCSANHWEFTRGPQGWRVTRRVSRQLDGSAESHAVLTGAMGAREP